MNDDILANAVARFLEDNHGKAAVDMLDAIIARGDGAEMIGEVVRREQSLSKSREEAVSRTMQRLESLELRGHHTYLSVAYDSRRKTEEEISMVSP